MSRSSLYAAMAMYGIAGLNEFSGGPKPEPPEKPCRNCGTMKRHNNDYCSAKCCKEFREKKATGKNERTT